MNILIWKMADHLINFILRIISLSIKKIILILHNTKKITMKQKKTYAALATPKNSSNNGQTTCLVKAFTKKRSY